MTLNDLIKMNIIINKLQIDNVVLFVHVAGIGHVALKLKFEISE